MTRASIKRAIAQHCVKVSILPKIFLGDHELSTASEVFAVSGLPGIEKGTPSDSIDHCDLDGWLLTQTHLCMYQQDIEEPFRGQVFDTADDETLVIYLFEKDGERMLVQAAHISWNTVRAVQLVKDITVYKESVGRLDE